MVTVTSSRRGMVASTFIALLLINEIVGAVGLRANEPTFSWTKLETEPYRGKQDDIFFVTPETGWYVNGAGRIFKTTDGGKSWTKQLDKPGTYFRCLGFVDENRGFAGNIGTEYFPNVTDETPLYETLARSVTLSVSPSTNWAAKRTDRSKKEQGSGFLKYNRVETASAQD